jgi:hypothetical protein
MSSRPPPAPRTTSGAKGTHIARAAVLGGPPAFPREVPHPSEGMSSRPPPAPRTAPGAKGTHIARAAPGGPPVFPREVPHPSEGMSSRPPPAPRTAPGAELLDPRPRASRSRLRLQPEGSRPRFECTPESDRRISLGHTDRAGKSVVRAAITQPRCTALRSGARSNASSCHSQSSGLGRVGSSSAWRTKEWSGLLRRLTIITVTLARRAMRSGSGPTRKFLNRGSSVAPMTTRS